MPKFCKCGGRLVPMYCNQRRDVMGRRLAVFVCNRCSVERTQRVRIKKKETA